jgi:hypothetical protein
LGALIWGARAPDHAEQVARLANLNLLRPPESALYQDVSQAVLRGHLEHYQGARGAAERHRLWLVQQAVRALIDAGVVTASPAILELLDRHTVPDDEGGWLLSDGALWQSYDDPRMGSVLGTDIH